MRLMKAGPVAALLALAALVIAPAASALLAETAVVATPLSEADPAGDWNAARTREYITYDRNSRLHPNHYDAFLRKINTTSPRFTKTKLNTRGQGYGGGIDTPRVIYQQVYRGQSNLKLYRIDTRTRPALPAGVNTTQWEWHPTISGDWILFGRRKPSIPHADKIMLFNLATLESRTLSTSTDFALSAGQVEGDWAVWSRCVTVCNVFKYQISTATTTKLARPDPTSDDPVHQWGPSVTGDGTVYLARGHNGCGESSEIVRYGASDPAEGTVVAELPFERRDLGFTYARANDDGSTDVFYDRYNCATGWYDIYKVHDP
jgi:hypothetical protein